MDNLFKNKDKVVQQMSFGQNEYKFVILRESVI